MKFSKETMASINDARERVASECAARRAARLVAEELVGALRPEDPVGFDDSCDRIRAVMRPAVQRGADPMVSLAFAGEVYGEDVLAGRARELSVRELIVLDAVVSRFVTGYGEGFQRAARARADRARAASQDGRCCHDPGDEDVIP